MLLGYLLSEPAGLLPNGLHQTTSYSSLRNPSDHDPKQQQQQNSTPNWKRIPAPDAIDLSFVCRRGSKLPPFLEALEEGGKEGRLREKSGRAVKLASVGENFGRRTVIVGTGGFNAANAVHPPPPSPQGHWTSSWGTRVGPMERTNCQRDTEDRPVSRLRWWMRLEHAMTHVRGESRNACGRERVRVCKRYDRKDEGR